MSSLIARRPVTALAILLAFGVGFGTILSGQDAPKKTPIETKMREKLTAAATVLEGLAIEDADVVQSGTKVLAELSKAEVWQVLKDTEYREHTQAFRSAIRRLDEAVQQKEFAAAQLEWLDATKKCFDCHNYIRKARASAKP